MSPNQNNVMSYEHPLNERMRAFLRLEYLFLRFEHQLSQGDDIWSGRAGVESIIDIITILGRMDIKSELIKELERYIATFENLIYNPNVDSALLTDILTDTKHALGLTRTMESVPGGELQQNVLLTTVRQRNTIPAGTCGFDVPGFDYWLQCPSARRKNDLGVWFSAFDVIREGIAHCLRLLRGSAAMSREQATGGFFQRVVEKGVPLQLVRVILPEGAPWYPEISAGRHRFTIRFMMGAAMEDRPAQTEENVAFQLLSCAI
uniref:Cell division protein ZapD n=1 Tax=Candidatus Kentrum sp. DK TaxID=2126562 RepID=A0A450SLS8_9GAMM|nr:MAG: cell division protein ZapD [Candidatus Kentron sp. DK]